MEAPELKELLRNVEVRNPSWYPFIHGYLNGELSNLELDLSEPDYDEQYYPELNLGNFDSCIVGEAFGFKSIYKHGNIDNCFVCARYAQKLYDNSGVEDVNGELNLESQRANFAQVLSLFYRHREFMK